jgi:hypothetical protein
LLLLLPLLSWTPPLLLSWPPPLLSRPLSLLTSPLWVLQLVMVLPAVWELRDAGRPQDCAGCGAQG